MTLIIEDGSQVADANTYVSDAEFVAYAAARAYSIPSGASDREVLLIKAIDYLASLEGRYKGDRTSSTQVLSYPRIGVDLNGYLLASDTIPPELKNGQMELAFQLSTEEVLINETVSNLSGFNVQGVYSETYGSGGASQAIRTRKADAYLSNLLHSITRLTRA